MKVLFTCSEAFPFSKTGGLADMALFLPKSLMQLGHYVKIITPYYNTISKHHDKMKLLGSATIKFGEIETIVNYYELVYQKMTYIFVQNKNYFERDNLYGYDDDIRRFTCFSYSALEIMKIIDFYPHILHLNDWQTGIVAYLLDEHYRKVNDSYFSIHTLLTIHNFEYQGSFDKKNYPLFNTDFNYSYIHFDRINLLKAGIERATRINTVSPTYRNEVLTSYYGFSLDGSLANRSNDFTGILNGIDDAVFNPLTDNYLVKNYDVSSYKSGKLINKKYILEHFNLNVDLDVPLVSYIGRLATQKGIDLIVKKLEEVVKYSDARFILMGSGNTDYENFFRYLSYKYPKKVACYIGFNEKIAHQLYAASDIFMMPSVFEPCGLGQLIAMRYGSLPLVRETGGLKDTVTPYNKYSGDGTGFSFKNYDSYELKEKLFESIQLYLNNQMMWQKTVTQAMKKDFSLQKMALEYEKIYQTILGV